MKKSISKFIEEMKANVQFITVHLVIAGLKPACIVDRNFDTDFKGLEEFTQPEQDKDFPQIYWLINPSQKILLCCNRSMLKEFNIAFDDSFNSQDNISNFEQLFMRTEWGNYHFQIGLCLGFPQGCAREFAKESMNGFRDKRSDREVITFQSDCDELVFITYPEFKDESLTLMKKWKDYLMPRLTENKQKSHYQQMLKKHFSIL